MALNHIAAVRQGSQITLLVNNNTLGTWVNGAITCYTRSGVAMIPNPRDPVADARFDNFAVSLCDASGDPINSQEVVENPKTGDIVNEAAQVDLEW